MWLPLVFLPGAVLARLTITLHSGREVAGDCRLQRLAMCETCTARCAGAAPDLCRAAMARTLACAHTFAKQREIEDIQALIEDAGGKAMVVGFSSGGAVTLETAAG